MLRLSANFQVNAYRYASERTKTLASELTKCNLHARLYQIQAPNLHGVAVALYRGRPHIGPAIFEDGSVRDALNVSVFVSLAVLDTGGVRVRKPDDELAALLIASTSDVAANDTPLT